MRTFYFGLHFENFPSVLYQKRNDVIISLLIFQFESNLSRQKNATEYFSCKFTFILNSAKWDLRLDCSLLLCFVLQSQVKQMNWLKIYNLKLDKNFQVEAENIKNSTIDTDSNPANINKLHNLLDSYKSILLRLNQEGMFHDDQQICS